jgi:hypothetical protein
MSIRPRQPALHILGLPIAALVLGALAVGSATAHTGAPSGITITPTGPLSIKASGTWHWSGIAGASVLSYVGFAIDWGDTASGNDIGTYHIGDGTPATNVVMQPTTPAQGSDGTFGPVSHTYALPGTYKACAIIYDLGPAKPFSTSGYHSLQAGGAGHNTDNSVDHGSQTPALCATFTLTGPSQTPVQSVPPTATPFESFQGETTRPTATPPSTSTAAPGPTQDTGFPVVLTLLIAGAMFATISYSRMARTRP